MSIDCTLLEVCKSGSCRAHCQGVPDNTAPKQSRIEHGDSNAKPAGAMENYDAEAGFKQEFHSNVQAYRTCTGHFTILEFLTQIMLPILVVALGALFSVLALKALAVAGL